MTAARLVHVGVAASLAAALFARASSAQAGETLRVTMTASEVPTTTGAPQRCVTPWVRINSTICAGSACRRHTFRAPAAVTQWRRFA